jgi:hypothetical protein
MCIVSSGYCQNDQDDEIDPKIYEVLRDILREKYQKDQVKVECILDYIKDNAIVDRFYTKELLKTENKQTLVNKINPYLGSAETSCRVDTPTKAPPKPNQPESATDPTLSEPSGGGGGIATWTFVVIGACVIAVIAIC